MDTKKFTMIDVPFVCENCGKKIAPLDYTARDHCPYCLTSKHVDIFPGDRQEKCQGLLKPIAIEKHKDTYKIIYRCDTCHSIRKNIMAKDDNYDLIVKLASNPVEY